MWGMGQEFKSRFYKTLKVGERIFYLFEELESFDKKKWNLSYIRVTSDRSGKNFVVESGAGIPKQRMEKQITTYLNKRFGNN